MRPKSTQWMYDIVGHACKTLVKQCCGIERLWNEMRVERRDSWLRSLLLTTEHMCLELWGEGMLGARRAMRRAPSQLWKAFWRRWKPSWVVRRNKSQARWVVNGRACPFRGQHVQRQRSKSELSENCQLIVSGNGVWGEECQTPCLNQRG
jgi:hypothetical protein